MRTIIAGSRGILSYRHLLDAIKAAAFVGFTPTVVLSGTASGVDQLGERWARENKVPLELYPADWAKHGRRAGHLRNIVMAEKAEALIAVWDGSSPGTRHMIDAARKRGLRIVAWAPR